MTTYVVGGISLAVDFDLRLLRPVAVVRPHAVVRRGHVTIEAPIELRYARKTPDGTVINEITRDRAGYVICAHDVSIRVAFGGNEVVYDSIASPLLLEQHLVGTVIPLLLQLRGFVAVHASAVERPSGGVLAFVGFSGAGKSTSAASLCPPCRLVSDDCLYLRPEEGRIAAYPSAGPLKLLDDAVARLEDRAPAGRFGIKSLVDAPESLGANPLERVYILSAAPEFALEPLGPSDAIAALMPHIHRLEAHNATLLEAEAEALFTLVQTSPVARLRVPRGQAGLDALAALLLGSTTSA